LRNNLITNNWELAHSGALGPDNDQSEIPIHSAAVSLSGAHHRYQYRGTPATGTVLFHIARIPDPSMALSHEPTMQKASDLRIRLHPQQN
jgi:hypothetical protein